MKLSELYERAISIGMEHDPRGRETVRLDLEARKKELLSLKEAEKEFFDKENLRNPYADSRVLYGSLDGEIGSILVGIDIDVGEVLLCDRLRQKGTDIDLIVAHHPGGKAYATLYEVMRIQADILSRVGVPINIAEDLMEGRIKEVERRLLPANHTRAVDAARLLDIPLICLHTPADNMVATYLQRTFDDQKPHTLGDIVDILKSVPEYREASYNGAAPRVLIGSGTRKTGKIFVDMTGGTEGSKEIFQSLVSGGISTVVAMHLSEDHRKEAEKHHLNVVIAGHISSDNLGLNLLLDELMKEVASPFAVYECSGFRRFKRSAPAA